MLDHEKRLIRLETIDELSPARRGSRMPRLSAPDEG